MRSYIECAATLCGVACWSGCIGSIVKQSSYTVPMIDSLTFCGQHTREAHSAALPMCRLTPRSNPLKTGYAASSVSSQERPAMMTSAPFASAWTICSMPMLAVTFVVLSSTSSVSGNAAPRTSVPPLRTRERSVSIGIWE